MMRRSRAMGFGMATGLALALGMIAMAASAAPQYREVREDGWTTYIDDDFGYTLAYPSVMFEREPPVAGSEVRTFLSPDKRAKIVVSAVKNDAAYTLASYRAAILGEFGGYDQMDYSPTGGNWFVLSGYRGENIYYQKVMFSCGSKVINVFSFTYPKAQRTFYEGRLEVMENKFRPGIGRNTPVGCR
jgi:hypothetical protein